MDTGSKHLIHRLISAAKVGPKIADCERTGTPLAIRHSEERVVVVVELQYCEYMCGRFTLHSRDRLRLKGLPSLDLPFEARYNIAPSLQILAIADFGKGVEAGMLAWGLIPSWSTDGKGFINARAETLEEKPSFSESFRWRRCLIPADGFYEFM